MDLVCRFPAVVAALVLLLAPGPDRFQAPAAVQAPAAAATLTKTEMAHFLSTAKVINSKEISKGVTGPSRLTMSNGTFIHDAAFSAVDEHTAVMKFANGRTEIDFIDSYRYSIAAYRLAEALGLDDMMPVTVERTWNMKSGAVTWWID